MCGVLEFCREEAARIGLPVLFKTSCSSCGNSDERQGVDIIGIKSRIGNLGLDGVKALISVGVSGKINVNMILLKDRIKFDDGG